MSNSTSPKKTPSLMKRPKVKMQEDIVLERNVSASILCDDQICVVNVDSLTPLSPKPSRQGAKSTFNLVSSQSIESKLGEFGYTPNGKLVINDEVQGEKVAKFIKAYDKNCNQIYVYNNTEGYAVFSEKDMVEVDTQNSTLPPSIRIGLAQTATKDMYGIAVESKDTITILRMEGNRLDEQRFRLNSNNGNPYDDYVSYPIFKLTDISSNPREVLESSRVAVSALDAERARSLSLDLSTLTAASQQFATLMKSNFDLLQTDYEQVVSSLSLLYQLNKFYSETELLEEEEKNKYLDVRHNIMIRRDYLQSIFRLMEEMRKMSSDIQNKLEILKGVNHEAVEKIVDIDSVIPR